MTKDEIKQEENIEQATALEEKTVKKAAKATEKKEDANDLLVSTELYLKAGVHIGTKNVFKDMRKYVFKQREDNLKVLDLKTIDDRIRLIADFISGFEPKSIVVVGRKLYAAKPLKKFAEVTGAKAIEKRFVPGTFTNSSSQTFVEPKVVIISDPESDGQAIKEATMLKIPVIALVSTNNTLKDIDIAMPINNKGRKSLALFYWILAREFVKKKKIDSEFKFDEKSMEDFEFKMKDQGEWVPRERDENRDRDRDRDRRGPRRERERY